MQSNLMRQDTMWPGSTWTFNQLRVSTKAGTCAVVLKSGLLDTMGEGGRRDTVGVLGDSVMYDDN